MKQGITRRSFLNRSLGAVAAAAAFPHLVPASAFGANARLTVAVIGTGGRGQHLARQFSKLSEVRVVAACDLDSRELKKCVDETNKQYGDAACQPCSDFREIMARTAPEIQVIGPLMEAEGLQLHADYTEKYGAAHHQVH